MIGMKHAVREDPDVMLWEICVTGVVREATRRRETGHLVFGPIHARPPRAHRPYSRLVPVEMHPAMRSAWSST